jgi:hypothetical protein
LIARLFARLAFVPIAALYTAASWLFRASAWLARVAGYTGTMELAARINPGPFELFPESLRRVGHPGHYSYSPFVSAYFGRPAGYAPNSAATSTVIDEDLDDEDLGHEEDDEDLIEPDDEDLDAIEAEIVGRIQPRT